MRRNEFKEVFMFLVCFCKVLIYGVIYVSFEDCILYFEIEYIIECCDGSFVYMLMCMLVSECEVL